MLIGYGLSNLWSWKISVEKMRTACSFLFDWPNFSVLSNVATGKAVTAGLKGSSLDS